MKGIDEPPRTIKELLIIVRDNKSLFISGLCVLIYELYISKKITWVECSLMSKYIYNNRRNNNKYGIYHWEIGNWRPRLIWLNKQIKKLSK